MEQPDQQQEQRGDGSTRQPEERPALETGGEAAEQSFSLLQELPGPLMQQLVQRHLDGTTLLALLRTSHSLAQAVVQHHTHQQRSPLTWTWNAREDVVHSGASVMDEALVATAVSLLERWAPAELHITLRGVSGAVTSFSLPPTVLPPLTHLRLHHVHLTPAIMDSLQQCQRLHTLDVDECSTAGAPSQSPPHALQALPLLRTFRYRRAQALLPWALDDLFTLCALATEVRSDDHVDGLAHRFAQATRWVVEGNALTSETLTGLLQLPALRHVRVPGLALLKDHSRQACRWETLTVDWLRGVYQLQQLPSGVGRVAVAEGLSFVDFLSHDVAALLEEGVASWLQLRVDTPPRAAMVKAWRLGGEERLGGFFRLGVQGAPALVAHAELLRSTLLAPDAGPHTLEVMVASGQNAETPASVARQVLPLLAGTRVRTLCMWLGSELGALRGFLGTLPANVTCLRLHVTTLEDATELVFGEAVAHPLRLVLLVLPRWRAFGDEKRLRALCAAHQPMLELEVGAWE